MLIELHILQNFAPSNLNRDETGAPKTCQFGGYRRARISSQCLKRAMRTTFKDDHLVDTQYLGVRTRRLVTERLVPSLQGAGKPADEARRVAEAALKSAKLKMGSRDKEKTEYLLFLAPGAVARLGEACMVHWDRLLAFSFDEGSQATGREAKKRIQEKAPAEAREAVMSALRSGKAVDIALFGRMLADLGQEYSPEGASQVAHAISTHRADTEFDFYTAVDDLQRDRGDDSQASDLGAGMMGTIEFNSACFYRYANLETEALAENLEGDRQLAGDALWAWLRASAGAIPTGKQNSMAAHNPPSLIFAVASDRRPRSLVNAFAKPVTAGQGEEDDLMARSIERLGHYRDRLAGMYGSDGVWGSWLATTEPEVARAALRAEPIPFDQLVDEVVAASGLRTVTP